MRLGSCPPNSIFHVFWDMVKPATVIDEIETCRDSLSVRRSLQKHQGVQANMGPEWTWLAQEIKVCRWAQSEGAMILPGFPFRSSRDDMFHHLQWSMGLQTWQIHGVRMSRTTSMTFEVCTHTTMGYNETVKLYFLCFLLVKEASNAYIRMYCFNVLRSLHCDLFSWGCCWSGLWMILWLKKCTSLLFLESVWKIKWWKKTTTMAHNNTNYIIYIECILHFFVCVSPLKETTTTTTATATTTTATATSTATTTATATTTTTRNKCLFCAKPLILKVTRTWKPILISRWPGCSGRADLEINCVGLLKVERP